MNQSTYNLKTAFLILLAVTGVMLLGAHDALAQQDFGTMAKTGVLKNQTGGAASLVKQGSIILGAAFAVGGIFKLYANAKDGFKEGAKGFVVPFIMILAGGLMFGATTLTNIIVRKSTGTEGDAVITNTTGGAVEW